jgi:hypothetical protein
MRIAILSAGDTLPRQWQPRMGDRYDAIIAINAAANLFPHDWLSCADTVCLRGLTRARPRLGLYTMATNRDLYRAGAFPWLGEDLRVITWQDLYPPEREIPRHLLDYSLPMSLLLAAHLANDVGDPLAVIDIYGHVGRPERALDGQHHANRGDARWKKEAACFAALAEWTGVTVRVVETPTDANYLAMFDAMDEVIEPDPTKFQHPNEELPT